jgi:hypothetical protein
MGVVDPMHHFRNVFLFLVGWAEGREAVKTITGRI